MLILSRKKDESIIINSNVEVIVISIKKNRIRLGVKTPDDENGNGVKVLRGELLTSLERSCQFREQTDAEVRAQDRQQDRQREQAAKQLMGRTAGESKRPLARKVNANLSKRRKNCG